MKSLLLVSIAFPPKNDPECLQTAKYFKYLSENLQLKISVVTSSLPTLFMPYDKMLEKYNKGFAQKIFIPVYETKLTNFLLRKILPQGIDFPDSKFSFHLRKRKVVRNLENKPSVIYSRSNPLSSALLAWKLKKYYQVPWMMHLSDPWTDSPVHRFTAYQRRYQQQWEEKCFRDADLISFTSRQSIDFYRNKYPDHERKYHYFPNVYDPDDVRKSPLEFGEKLRVVYTGGLTAGRSPAMFLEACRRLVARSSQYENKLEVTFAGPADSTTRALFNEVGLPFVRHVGMVSYQEALAMQRDAHILLNIDPPVKDAVMAMFFPSKLLDYFIAGRKIISITNKRSASANILNDLNCNVFDHDNIGSLMIFLLEAINAHKAKQAEFFVLKALPEEFNAKLNADRLAELLTSL